MTRILKRGQKTYFKEDVVACLADETLQKTFTQSEYGNRIVFMEELQEEAKERFNMDFTDEDYKSFKTLIATGKYFTDEEMEHYNSMNKDEILPAWLLEKCGLSDYTKNSQAVARPDWMEEYEILIDRDNDYVLLRDPDENVNQVWTASGKFLSTVQLENETVTEAMEEYYYNITKGGFYIPDRIKEGYMEEDYDNLSKEDIEL